MAASANEARDAETDHREALRCDMHAMAKAIGSSVYRTRGGLTVHAPSFDIVACEPELVNDGGNVYTPHRGKVQIVTTLPRGPARAAEFGVALRALIQPESTPDKEAETQS
ncbi:hypothetical protein [Nocardia sp. NBC_01377]|uniref:hypothetical protein n=1 Tax=Nocardia sp. NBC_01377 TaxID=2903595 RepID=UPI002F906C23